MGKVAAIGRDGRFMVNPSNHSESTTHYSKSYISEGPAVTDGLVLYLDADDWGSYPGTKTLTGKFTEYSSGSSHYRTMGRNGVVLLGTSTSWIGYFSADPSSTGRHTIMFDYWSDVAQSNSLVLDNDGIHDNQYNATLSTQTYRQTRFQNFTHTTTGNIKFYFRNNVAGNKVYVDNVRFFKSDDTWNDLSGNGYDGTINGATPAIDSAAGLYFDFDGSNDYVVVTNGMNSLVGTNATTFGAWIYIDTVTSSWDGVIANKVNVAEGIALLVSNTQKIFFQYDSTSGNYAIDGGSNIPTAEWTYIVATYDTVAGYKTYMNGELNDSEADAGKSIASSGDMSINIGAQRNSSGNPGAYFPGRIAKAEIYNKALSAEEVKQNFNSERNRFGV